MLIIRQQQLDALEASVEENFAAQLCIHFREYYSEALTGYTDVELHERMRHAISKARGFGLSRTRVIADFAAKCLFDGPYFYESQPYRAALEQIRRSEQPDAEFPMLESLALAFAEAQGAEVRK